MSENGDPPPQDELFPLYQDDLIEQLVTNAGQVPDVIVFTGFLGHSSRDEYWRLYLTPELNDYIEFKHCDVRYASRIPQALSSLGGTHVWLDRNAEVRRVRTASRQAQAEFLQGELIAQHQARAAANPATLDGTFGSRAQAQRVSVCGITCPSTGPIPPGSVMRCETLGYLPEEIWELAAQRRQW